jgi:hypothetical protein
MRLLVALVSFAVAVGASTVWVLAQLRREPAPRRLALALVALTGYAGVIATMVVP